MSSFEVTEAGIGDLRGALESGRVTAVQLVEAYLRRIEAYDRSGPTLNSIVVFNDDALAEAADSDRRRSRAELLGPLDGIPYTAKDSYLAKGLTAAAGSYAFADLVAQKDAFAIEQLRRGRAILIGLTNMPAMANGGMQRGLYGRAESPYNEKSFSPPRSGRVRPTVRAQRPRPASRPSGWGDPGPVVVPGDQQRVVRVHPSRGVISVRGNWPLVPTMDVVVPHTRTMADMAEVLDVIVADDADTRGDLWRSQPWIAIPAASKVRPGSLP